MFICISFFRLGKFSSITLLKIFIGPLIWESLLSSIPVILRFGSHILSWISWMILDRKFLHFAFSLTVMSMCFFFLIFFLFSSFFLARVGGGQVQHRVSLIVL